MTVMTGAAELTSGMNARTLMTNAALTVLLTHGERSNPDSTSHLHPRAGNPTRMGVTDMPLTEIGLRPKWQVWSGNLATERKQKERATDQQPGLIPQPPIVLTSTSSEETWHVGVKGKLMSQKKDR